MGKGNTTIEEIKTKVAERIPPGDRWVPIDNLTLTMESLTDMLEYVYQKEKTTKFLVDADEGVIYTVRFEEKTTEPTPPKSYSLYGED